MRTPDQIRAEMIKLDREFDSHHMQEETYLKEYSNLEEELKTVPQNMAPQEKTSGQIRAEMIKLDGLLDAKQISEAVYLKQYGRLEDELKEISEKSQVKNSDFGKKVALVGVLLVTGWIGYAFLWGKDVGTTHQSKVIENENPIQEKPKVQIQNENPIQEKPKVQIQKVTCFQCGGSGKKSITCNNCQGEV